MDYTIFPRKTSLLIDSHILGHIECSYDRLVEMFNYPFKGDGKDSDCEWNIMLMNGHPISIRNYRNGHAYNGQEGLDDKDIKNWIISGHFDYDFDELKEFLEGKITYIFSANLKAQNKETLVKTLQSILEHIKDGHETGANWNIVKEKTYEK